jgi:hypothetical protein
MVKVWSAEGLVVLVAQKVRAPVAPTPTMACVATTAAADGLHGEHAEVAPGGGVEVLGVLHRARILADAGHLECRQRRLGLTPALVRATLALEIVLQWLHASATSSPTSAHAVPTATVWKSTLDGSPPASSNNTIMVSALALRNDRGTW